MENGTGTRWAQSRWAQKIILALAALAPAAVHAADIPLLADTYISGALPTLNFGGLANLNVGNTTNNNVALVKFDLSVLPAFSGVSHATLRVFVNKVGTAGAIDVLAVTSPWAESTVTAQFPPTLGTMIATAIPVAGSGSYVTVDVTLMVQDWVSLGAFFPNNGFAIVANASAPSTSIFLDSKESTTTSHPATLDVTLNGPAGPQGLSGQTGATGAAGPQGGQGIAGTPGTAGPQGLQGTAGTPGTTGPQGLQGVQGTVGTAGVQGPAGPAGVQGVAGVPGIQGAAGDPGLPGNLGTPGTPGLVWRGVWNPDPNFHYLVGDAVSYNGSSYIAISPNNGGRPDLYVGVLWATLSSIGASGPAGVQGVPGSQGAVGPAGPQGVAGATGAQGPTGQSGSGGTQAFGLPANPFFAELIIGTTNPLSAAGSSSGVIAVTSITITSESTQSQEINVLLARTSLPSCGGSFVEGYPPNLLILVPAGQTIHLTYPSPVVFNGPATGLASSCVAAAFASPSTGDPIVITVNGYVI